MATQPGPMVIDVLVVGLSWMMASNCMAVVCLGRMKLCLAVDWRRSIRVLCGLGTDLLVDQPVRGHRDQRFCNNRLTLSLAALTVGCYLPGTQTKPYRVADRRPWCGYRRAAFGIVDQFLQSPIAEHWSAALNFACLCILPWAARSGHRSQSS